MLFLQIQRRKGTDATCLAMKIIEDNFEEFTKKHYDKILKRHDIVEDQLKDAIAEILKLNPKPGSSYSNPLNKVNQVIVPDFLLDNIDGELQLSLNQGNVPDLRMSNTYTDMLKTYSENKKNISRDQKDAMMFVKQKMDSAKWFIDAIRQRHNTLFVVMTEIIEFQREFFRMGMRLR